MTTDWDSGLRRVWLLLGAALAVRLLVMALVPPDSFFLGGDGPYYVRLGWELAHGGPSVPMTKSGPLYPLLLASAWLFFPMGPGPISPESIPPAYLTSIRLLQVSISVLLAWMGYRLAIELGFGRSAAVITAFGLGLGPAFVLAPEYLLTELVFMAFLTGAVLAYVRFAADGREWLLGLAGLLLGLASLTRPVALLLPLLLGGQMLAQRWRVRSWRLAAVLIGPFLVLVVPWMWTLHQVSGSPLPEGVGANLWIGASYEGTWAGTSRTYDRSQAFGGDREDFAPEAFRIIRSDPLSWLRLRSANLLAALAVPYVTADLGGPSIRQLTAEWLRGDRSVVGLLPILTVPTFFPKLVIYVFHYFALVFGAVGGAISISQRRAGSVLVGVIVYFLLVHGILNALPRYLFPAFVFLWVFAGFGFLRTAAWFKSAGRVIWSRWLPDARPSLR
jgi:4-amino-4-deoxy-L-arabinose transferase-like glycosyltransferase